MGRPASPFIGEGKAWVTTEEEKNERERERERERGKKAFKVARSFFSFIRVPPIL